jgi:hypothetical protein
MKVEEIAEVVAKLLPDQLARFRRWLKPDCVAAVHISLTVESRFGPFWPAAMGSTLRLKPEELGGIMLGAGGEENQGGSNEASRHNMRDRTARGHGGARR